MRGSAVTALTLDDLIPSTGEASHPLGSSPPTQQKLPPNVMSFPTIGVRMQDVVLSLLLDGKGYEEIAQAISSPNVKRTSEDVRAIARSEWAQNEVKRYVASATPDSQRDTLQNLIRIQGFDAVQKLGALMKCGHAQTELGACRLALQYSLALPTAKTDVPRSGSTLPSEPDAIRSELDRLEKEIDRRRNPNAHIE